MASAAGLAGSGGGTSTATAAPELTRWLGARIVWPSSVTAPASISVLSRDRDSSATWRASTRSSRSPASGAATTIDFCVTVSAMTQVSNNSASGNPADAESLVARARLMMIISALTTLIAIAAVVSVIGYRMFSSGGATGADGVITLPKGARLISTMASGGRVAVLIDVGGVSELWTFDIKTLKQTGRLRFATEP